MPVITEYRHGLTMGIPPRMTSHQKAKRQQVEGWTNSSTRRNTKFLYSVDERKLTGLGFALTLTIRDCPATSADWKQVREAFFFRLRRMGLVRAHWLTEWQRRGVPHLHCALWIDSPEDQQFIIASEILDHWLEVAAPFGAGRRGQQAKAITDSVGWFQYLSKHAVRGLNHYQRSADSIPAGWKKTGRMWGKLGEWATVEPVRYLLDNPGVWAFRRIVQGWRVSIARESGDQGRLRAARRMLQSNDRNASSVRGCSEWIDQGMTAAVVAHLAARGFPISC